MIVVSGATQAATTYHVTVKAGVPDTFGQVLAADDAATITVGHADPRIYPFPTSVTTLDPMAAKPTVTVTTVGQKRFRERVFAVQGSDWAAFQGWLTHVLQLNTYRAGDDLQAPAWPVLADRTVTVPGAGDQLAATALDLSGPLDAEKKLPGGRTQIVVVIEPIDPTARRRRWAQPADHDLGPVDDARRGRDRRSDQPACLGDRPANRRPGAGRARSPCRPSVAVPFGPPP